MQDNKKKTVFIDDDRSLQDVLDKVELTLLENDKSIRILRPLSCRDKKVNQLWWDNDDIKSSNVMCIATRTAITNELMSSCPYLKGVVYPTIGWNTIDYDYATKRRIMIVNNPTWENYASLAEAIVMLMSALLLELKKRIEQCQKNVLRPKPSEITSAMLAGKTIGLVGYGRVAKEVKERLVPWKCKEILVVNRHPHLIRDKDVTICDIQTIFESADVISVHLPLNPQTAKLIDYKMMSRSKNGFFLISTSRGGVVCEESLVKALKEGKVKAAAVDVFEKEPLSANHPLRLEKNVILTNHIIGHTRELFDSLTAGIVKSITEILANKMPQHCVNSKDLQSLANKI